jgi:hypothetical protein
MGLLFQNVMTTNASEATTPHVWRSEEGHYCFSGELDKLYEILSNPRDLYRAMIRISVTLSSVGPEMDHMFHRLETMEEFGFFMEAILDLEQVREKSFLTNIPKTNLS